MGRDGAVLMLCSLVMVVAFGGDDARALALPPDLPAAWSTPSAEGDPVAPAFIPPLSVPRAKPRYGLPGPDTLTVASNSGGELHGLEGADVLYGRAGPDHLY